MESAEFIKQQAAAIGFDLCGVAPALAPLTWPHFENWLDAGCAGEMKYLENRREAYQHPEFVLEAVRSVIMTAVCYSPDRSRNAESAAQTGQVARYALGQKDYHDTLKTMLKELSAAIHERYPANRTRAVVDTAPLLERDFARQAGLGWFGKNTMLLNKQRGSFFFLGAVLTDLELEPDLPFETAHCGTCTRCLEVCPTEALVEPQRLDARRCISYLTIELRQQPIPVELRSSMQDWMFGCDLCQVVCPWNRHAPEPRRSEFLPQLAVDQAAEFLRLEEDAFRLRYKKTPLSRPGRVGMARNAAIVLGNSGDPQFLEVLRQSLNDPHPLVRGAVVWAIGELAREQAATLLAPCSATETDAEVLQEIRDVLEKYPSNSD